MRRSLVPWDAVLRENTTIVTQLEETWMVLVEFIYHHSSVCCWQKQAHLHVFMLQYCLNLSGSRKSGHIQIEKKDLVKVMIEVMTWVNTIFIWAWRFFSLFISIFGRNTFWLKPWYPYFWLLVKSARGFKVSEEPHNCCSVAWISLLSEVISHLLSDLY